jgi:hypothetical protein
LARRTPQSALAFGHTLALGSLESDDAAHVAVSTLLTGKAGTRPARAEALTLAPNPAMGPALEALLYEPKPVNTLAIAILAERREVKLGMIAPLLAHPDMSVRLAAARAMGVAPRGAATTAFLTRALADEPQPEVCFELALSLVLLGVPDGVEALRRLLPDALEAGDEQQRDRCVRALALGGSAKDGQWLTEIGLTTPALVDGAGYFGALQLVEPLIDLIDARQPPALRTAATRALRRIAGDSVPEPAVQNAEAWRGWWSKAGASLAMNRKHRFGRLLSTELLLDALCSEGATTAERDAYAFEIAIRTGTPPIHTRGWVALQLAEISTLREHLADSDPSLPKLSAGQWPADQPKR